MKSTINRPHRIGELLQKELALSIRKDLDGSKMGWATITGIEVSRDLEHAKVFVSVLQEEMMEQTLKILNDASGFFRRELSHKMNMRKVPKFRFIFDDSVMKGHRMSMLIDACVNT